MKSFELSPNPYFEDGINELIEASRETLHSLVESGTFRATFTAPKGKIFHVRSSSGNLDFWYQITDPSTMSRKNIRIGQKELLLATHISVFADRRDGVIVPAIEAQLMDEYGCEAFEGARLSLSECLISLEERDSI